MNIIRKALAALAVVGGLAYVGSTDVASAHQTFLTCTDRATSTWTIVNSEPDKSLTFTSPQGPSGSIAAGGSTTVVYSGTSLTINATWSNGFQRADSGEGNCVPAPPTPFTTFTVKPSCTSAIDGGNGTIGLKVRVMAESAQTLTVTINQQVVATVQVAANTLFTETYRQPWTQGASYAVTYRDKQETGTFPGPCPGTIPTTTLPPCPDCTVNTVAITTTTTAPPVMTLPPESPPVTPPPSIPPITGPACVGTCQPPTPPPTAPPPAPTTTVPPVRTLPETGPSPMAPTILGIGFLSMLSGGSLLLARRRK